MIENEDEKTIEIKHHQLELPFIDKAIKEYEKTHSEKRKNKDKRNKSDF